MKTEYRHPKSPPRLRLVLSRMRMGLIAFGLLFVLILVSLMVIRTALLRNAQESGTAMARNLAAEEQSNLSVYQTLLSFGTASIDLKLSEGASAQDLQDWMALFYGRLESVLGSGTVDPYLVLDGQIIAANLWEGDDAYDATSTDWYRQAAAADGQVIFTSLYIDAVYGKPVITAAQHCKGANGVLAFDIFPENFNFQFTELSLSQGNSFFLCDASGALICQQTELDCSEQELAAYLSGIVEKINAGELDSYRDRIVDFNGDNRAVYYARMENGWLAIVTVSYDNIFASLSWFYIVSGILLLFFLLASLIVIWRETWYNVRIIRTNETVRVLGNSYYALYRIDFRANRYEMIKGSDYVRARLPEQGSYDELQQVLSEIIEPDAQEDYMRSFSREGIQDLVRRRVRDFGGDFLRRFGEEYRWVNVRLLFDESLAPGEVVLCFREVGKEKQRQLQELRLLEDALESARRNEAAQQSFFSNMSHDMRTPLNAIIGLSDLAAQHAEDPAQMRDYLQKINLSSRQLLGLINDILDMSRMSQGKMVLEHQQFDLQEEISQCLEGFRFQAGSEHKQLTADFDLKERAVVGDPFRLVQILNNLLSNAFKFTGEGGKISLSVRQLEVGEGDFPKYRITVSDTGVGMSASFLPHLFEPYSRETRFGAKQTVGTGLGMPITKNLVTQMNGEIHVESAPGKGSTFTVTLPFEAAQLPQQQAPAPAAQQDVPLSLEGLRVLLAEDNEVNMEISTELLSMNGVEVVQAWNGQEAVDLFAASEPYGFDAILMDMQMPVLDGCGAARQIRKMDRPDAAAVPIIAVTANAFAEDIAATDAAGMNAHISKPIDFGLLCGTLQKLIQKAKSGGGKE